MAVTSRNTDKKDNTVGASGSSVYLPLFEAMLLWHLTMQSSEVVFSVLYSGYRNLHPFSYCITLFVKFFTYAHKLSRSDYWGKTAMMIMWTSIISYHYSVNNKIMSSYVIAQNNDNYKHNSRIVHYSIYISVVWT